MNFKVKSRDFKVFILGVFVAFLIMLIYDWKEFKRGFMDGYHDGLNAHGQTQQVDQKE